MIPFSFRVAMTIGALALGGATAGAVAGMAAGDSIDGFYAAAPSPRYRTVMVEPSSGWDGTTSATYAATTPLPPIMPEEIDRDGLPLDDGFDVRGLLDDPPVRVHRASTTAIRREVPAPVPEPARDDGGEDGWVDAPTTDREMPAEPS